ncbi:hypothetical protein [Xylanibacter ruminicola]|nr:hypothetical protein [Xylanibacter ruminicola]
MNKNKKRALCEYVYRARIKNKAAGNRDDFEQRVKEIGIQG